MKEKREIWIQLYKWGRVDEMLDSEYGRIRYSTWIWNESSRIRSKGGETFPAMRREYPGNSIEVALIVKIDREKWQGELPDGIDLDAYHTVPIEVWKETTTSGATP